MENNKKKFAITDNKETADMLKKDGYKLVSNNNGEWVFLNNPNKHNFEKLGDVVFTNKLNI